MANQVVFMGKGGTAKVSWFDANGNTDNVAVNADEAWTSDNEAVATVAADPNDDFGAVITPVSPGTFNLGCSGTNKADGSAVTATPVAIDIAAPDAVSGTVAVTPAP